MANVKNKTRLHLALIAGGLPVIGLYNDASGNLGLQWSSGPTGPQQATADGIIAGFDDTNQIPDNIDAVQALLLMSSASFPGMNTDQKDAVTKIVNDAGTGILVIALS